MLTVFGDINVIKILRGFQNRSSVHVECDSKCDTGSNMGDWNHIKITQTIPELHTGEGQN